MDDTMPAHHFMRRRIMQQNQLQASLAGPPALQSGGTSRQPPASQAGPQAQGASVAGGQASKGSLQRLRSSWSVKLRKSLNGMLKRSPSDAEGPVQVGGSLAPLHAGWRSYSQCRSPAAGLMKFCLSEMAPGAVKAGSLQAALHMPNGPLLTGCSAIADSYPELLLQQR